MRYASDLRHKYLQQLSGWSGLAKWLIDKIFSTIALVIFAPLLVSIAAAIRIETPGPILFRQKRHGFDVGPITVYKFRSMEHIPHGSTFRQAIRNDSRVTRVGRFLRWTSLDELPQLFNVLNGTMSLVGPRPHPVELDQQFAALIDGYNGRYRIKPGITGWAQINGLRGETKTVEAMRKRIEHDIYYVENWSLLLDLRILILTALRGWAGPNAY